MMLTELLYTFQHGDTPLHDAASRGRTTCVENLLSTLGIDVNINNEVSYCSMDDTHSIYTMRGVHVLRYSVRYVYL